MEKNQTDTDLQARVSAWVDQGACPVWVEVVTREFATRDSGAMLREYREVYALAESASEEAAIARRAIRARRYA